MKRHQFEKTFRNTADKNNDAEDADYNSVPKWCMPYIPESMNICHQVSKYHKIKAAVRVKSKQLKFQPSSSVLHQCHNVLTDAHLSLVLQSSYCL